MNKLLQSFIIEATKDVLDKALAKSDKRREEFLKKVKDPNPPKDSKSPESVSMREAMVKKVRKSLLEAAPPADPNAPPATPPPDATGGDVAPPPTSMGGVGDPSTIPPDPNAPPADPNAPATTPGADPNALPGTDTTGTDPTAGGLDMGGGGGGFGGGGGGIGGGGGGGAGPTDDTATPPAGGEGDDATGSAGEDEDQGDPITKAVDDAKELLDQTRDIPTILKSVKQAIQGKFEKPDHALGLVKALYDTQDPTLRSVAVRLYQFIKGS